MYVLCSVVYIQYIYTVFIYTVYTVYNNYTRGGALQLQMYGTGYCITNTVSASEGILFSGQTSGNSSGFPFWGGTRTYILSGTITYKA